MSRRHGFAAALAALVIAGCVRGPMAQQPRDQFNTLAVRVPAGTSATQVAQQVKSSASDLVLVFANADSAWYSELAAGTGLELSRSTPSEAGTMAFLASKPVGDTTLNIPVEGGSPLLVHDALYEIEEDQYIDLMAVRAQSGTPAREAVRALLGYLATDVMSTASLVLALHSESRPLADSLATLLRPALFDVRDCHPQDEPPPQLPSDVLFFYGPEARFECREVRALTGPGSPILARLAIPAR